MNRTRPPVEPVLRDLLAVLPEAHWLLTPAGTVVAANPAAAALAGRSEPDLAGAPLADLVSHDRTKLTRYLAMCARTREMVPGALTFRSAAGVETPCRCDGALVRPRSGGRPALILLRARPREAASGRFVSLSERIEALSREVARREEVERVLREQSELLRQQAELLERTHDAIIVWALGGGITYFNRAAEELYGWSRGEALGQEIHSFLRTQAQVSMAELDRLLRETGEWTGELVHTARDGRTVVVESRMVLLRGASELPLVVETLRDVTEARRVRAQLEAAQRLEAVGRLAGGVAHEINNALQGAIGFAAFALRALPPHDPVRDDVQQALKASERAAAITQDLLAFSRRQVLQPSAFDLGAAVGEFAPMLRQAVGRDRELRLELPSRPVVVHADRGQLEQVLLNLTLNARDATRPGGRITLRLDRIVLGYADARRLGHPELAPGGYARLEVCDTGHGMDPATAARIFEPFYTTKPPGQGTGLGLAVVHGIVHQSGGTIAVRTAPGEGSTFTLYLPEAGDRPPRSGVGRRARARAGRTSSERILIVEDEPPVVEVAARLLSEEGYTVLRAADGVEALQRLDERSARSGNHRLPVDLVLSDIIMPTMGGRELGDALAERYPDLPILYISGHAGEEMVQRGLLARGAEFIQKPFQPEELLRAVRSLLDRAKKPGGG